MAHTHDKYERDLKALNVDMRYVIDGIHKLWERQETLYDNHQTLFDNQLELENRVRALEPGTYREWWQG